eukprot:tig00001339_g8286.t1
MSAAFFASQAAVAPSSCKPFLLVPARVCSARAAPSPSPASAFALPSRRRGFVAGDRTVKFFARRLRFDGFAPAAASPAPPAVVCKMAEGDIVEYVSPYKGVNGETQYAVGQVVGVDAEGRIEIKPFEKVGGFGGKAYYAEDKRQATVLERDENVRPVESRYNAGQEAWEVAMITDPSQLPTEGKKEIDPNASVARFGGYLEDLDASTAAFGSAFSAVLAYGMNQATITLKTTFADNPVTFPNPVTAAIAEKFRDAFEVGALLASYVFAIVALGLIGLAITIVVRPADPDQ